MQHEAGSKYILLSDVGEENLENEVTSEATPGSTKQFKKIKHWELGAVSLSEPSHLLASN